MTRSEILDEAKKCVCGQRQQDYGSPEDNFSLIAKLWSDYLGVTVHSCDVAMCMILLKIARIKNGGGTGDSFVDIAGYSACGGEILGKTSKKTLNMTEWVNNLPEKDDEFVTGGESMDA